MLQIQLVVRAGIEPGTLDSKSGFLTTRPRCLPTTTTKYTIEKETIIYDCIVVPSHLSLSVFCPGHARSSLSD